MKEKKKKKLLEKLKNRYRLIIYNDTSFQTVWSTRLTRINVFLILGLGSILLIALTVLIIATTPVKELIPGYPTGDVRELMVQNAVMLDSLEEQIQLRDNYLKTIQTVLNGEVPAEQANLADTVLKPAELNVRSYNHDSIFEQHLLEEQLDLSIGAEDQKNVSLANLHLFNPMKGMVTEGFNKGINHFAVDIVGLPNARIASVMDGTVIFADWTVNTGYVMYIQHDNNLISVYKHNSELLKKTGDLVKAGEIIAYMGNTGELSTGPHLHFELWHKGVPLNPEEYIDF
ncbi:M23 family metallopeptidase [Mangrovibacterium marinum]|uniref:Peptidase M23-like protein n=1 Tax=Mangrovibacterium marinum TaxID=1639118 RepID=A0A2T5C690_9BACT|nr:M23 family metallopeptidase [Mangrovibacterium marinum]PTN10465.1 peptidase M23-like protein [Mangrovibacterium marinum]